MANTIYFILFVALILVLRRVAYRLLGPVAFKKEAERQRPRDFYSDPAYQASPGNIYHHDDDD